jgi:hypothetical protein
MTGNAATLRCKRCSWGRWPPPRLTAERLRKLVAVAVFSSDAISSTAYGTEQIMLVLVAAGAVATQLPFPIALAIGALLAMCRPASVMVQLLGCPRLMRPRSSRQVTAWAGSSVPRKSSPTPTCRPLPSTAFVTGWCSPLIEQAAWSPAQRRPRSLPAVADDALRPSVSGEVEPLPLGGSIVVLAAVPPACHRQRTRAVSSGQPRSVRERP